MTQRLDPTQRIARIGRAMQIVTIVVAVALVVAYVGIWLVPGALDYTIRRQVLPPGVPYTLTPSLSVAAFLAGLIPVATALWGLWNAVLLFRGYRTGDVFTETAGLRLRRMGAAVFVLPIVSAVISATASVLLTLNNPSGGQHLVVSVGLDALVLLVAGAVLVAIGWAMVEAARLAEENRGFV